MQVYFGVGKPNTYFYGEVSALTVGKVVRMFGGDTSGIPSVVAETGFPTGAMVCYLNMLFDFNLVITLIREGLVTKSF